MKYVIFTFVIFLISCTGPIELDEVDNYEIEYVYSQYSFNDSIYTTDSFTYNKTDDYIITKLGEENNYSYGMYYLTYIDDGVTYIDTITNFTYKIPIKTGGFVNGSLSSNPKNTTEYTYVSNGNQLDINFKCEIRFDTILIDILDTLYILEGSASIDFITP